MKINRITRVWLFSLIIPFLFEADLKAQTYFMQPMSATPNSFKWKEYENDTVRVVFKEGLEKQALQYAHNMLWQARDTSFSLGNNVRKLNILLHTENAQSNGYVGLAPYQSEFYLTPLHQTGELGSVNFGTLLSIHEYRHALQYSNSLKGFSRFVYTFTGQQGWAVFHHMAIPDWFSEGDAVLTETAFTKQGRGRMPSFLNDYRFLALSDVKYSYIKARNGSLKDYVPDHYALGYLLCRNGVDRFGGDFWKPVFEKSARGNPLFFSFKRAFKREAKISLNTFYNETIEKYYNDWLKDTIITENQYARQINDSTDVFTSYSYPQFVSDSEIVAQKKSLNAIPAFVKMDLEGNEELIAEVGISSDSYFNVAKNQIVYTEVRYNTRYEYLNYNEVVLLNLEDKTKRQLTFKSKTFAPSLNNNATKIVAMRLKEDLSSVLLEMDLRGKILNEITNKEGYYYTFPKYNNEEEIISAVRNARGYMSIVLINPVTKEHKALMPFTNNIITDVSVKNNKIYFTASFDGKDQLYYLNTEDGKVYSIISRVNFCYMPAVNFKGDFVIYTELNSKGRYILQSELNDFNYQEKKVIELEDLFAYQSEHFSSIVKDITPVSSNLQLGDYNKGEHLLNFHSWRPKVNRTQLGLTLYSQNLLNTLELEGGVFHNTVENKTFYNVSATYGGLYPIIKLESNIIPNRTIVYSIKDALYSDTTVTEKNIKTFIYVPFNFTKGLYESRLQVGSGLERIMLTSNLFFKNTFGINAYKASVNYFIAKRKAVRNFVSREAIYLQADFLKAINTNGYQYCAQTEFSLPALSKNDVFLVNLSALQQDIKSGYQFFTNYALNRGIQAGAYYQYYKASFNYQFTLGYPDGGINGLFFIYRIRVNPYLDLGYAHAFNKVGVSNINTAGVEFIADIKLFNALPFQAGIRYNKMLNVNYPYYKFLPVQVFIPVYFF